jgi:cell wall assembly regulator SMI1
MDNLLTTLTNLEAFFAESRSHLLENLLPGLSVQEINEKVAEFPFFLPEEFYTLYQWHNGIEIPIAYNPMLDLLPYTPFFYSLDECMRCYGELMQMKKEYSKSFDDNTLSPKWFPIIQPNDGYYFISGDSHQKQRSEVIFLGTHQEWHFGPNYESLTSFIESIYECYITGVYDIDNSEEVVCTSEKLEEEIHRKYNPNQPSWELRFE